MFVLQIDIVLCSLRKQTGLLWATAVSGASVIVDLITVQTWSESETFLKKLIVVLIYQGFSIKKCQESEDIVQRCVAHSS